MLTIFSYFFLKKFNFFQLSLVTNKKTPIIFIFFIFFIYKKYIFILISFCCQKRNKKIKTKSMFVKIRQALRRWTSSSSTLSSSLSSLQSVSHTCIEIIMNNIYYVLYNSLPLSLYFEHFYFSIYFILKSAYSWQGLFWFFAI